AAELPTVDLDDREHLADRRRRERLLGAEQLVERERTFAHLVPERRRLFEQNSARDSGEDTEVEARREQCAAAPPPDVRDRSLEYGAILRDEHGVVGAAAARLRLGRHVHRVARRFDAAEQPWGLGAHTE